MSYQRNRNHAFWFNNSYKFILLLLLLCFTKSLWEFFHVVKVILWFTWLNSCSFSSDYHTRRLSALKAWKLSLKSVISFMFNSLKHFGMCFICLWNIHFKSDALIQVFQRLRNLVKNRVLRLWLYVNLFFLC